MANLANTKFCKNLKNYWNPGTWLLIWQYSVRAFQLIPTGSWPGNLKMPVQNSNSKIFPCPDLATYLLQILTSTYQLCSIVYCVKKDSLHFSHALEDCLLEKYLIITPKRSYWKFSIEIFACPKRRFSGNCLSKTQAGRVLIQSLVTSHRVQSGVKMAEALGVDCQQARILLIPPRSPLSSHRYNYYLLFSSAR